MYIRSSLRRPNRDPNQTLSNKLLLLKRYKIVGGVNIAITIRITLKIIID